MNPAVQGAHRRLVYVLESEIGAPAPLSLVYVDREYQAPQVRAFIERAVTFFLGGERGSMPTRAGT